jgi:hypothetical protein
LRQPDAVLARHSCLVAHFREEVAAFLEFIVGPRFES